uniref:Uncharacterized protein n=1 Tax=Siphoviridae sp. ctmHK36 TaxID=2827931 RepID=A0A8S5TAS2_9CAUD|nr:MAG TPA: hypothetical protein [Siphoviridae sp. ctmHK36]
MSSIVTILYTFATLTRLACACTITSCNLSPSSVTITHRCL